jgi:hypothetical protein
MTPLRKRKFAEIFRNLLRFPREKPVCIDALLQHHGKLS